MAAAANSRGACSRPSEAPDPTASTCSSASIAIGTCENRLPCLMDSLSPGTEVLRRSSHQPSPASAHPIARPISRRSMDASLTPISSGPWSYPKLRCSRVRTRTVVNPPTTPLRTPVTRIAAANVR